MIEFRRERLRFAAQRCYNNILAAVKKQREEFDPGNADVRDIGDAYLAVYNDHPELFYMSSSFQVETREERTVGLFSHLRVSYRVKIQNIYSSAQIASCKKTIGKILDEIGEKSFENEVEAVLYCVDRIVLGTEYEINDRTNQNAAAALCYHKAQCSGIARAVKLLLDRLGIYCIVADGQAFDEDSGTGPHAWNIVRVGGKYYHVDATFMLGRNPGKRLPLYREFVFYDDARLSTTHQWDRSAFPVCDDGSIYPTLNRMSQTSSEDFAGEYMAVYHTLLELRKAIRKMIDARESHLSCRLNIPMKDSDAMMRAVTNSCQMVMSSSSVSVSFEINIVNARDVTLDAIYES